MSKYMVLSSWTEQGIKHLKDVPDRMKAWRKSVADAGGEVRDTFGVMGGAFDTVTLVSVPSDEVMARLVLELGALGNVRTQTLRVFTEDELKKIMK
jgi:uncharacterized protein with GYD domain